MNLDNHDLNQLQNHSLKTWIEGRLRRNGNQLRPIDIQQLNSFLDDWREKFLSVNNGSLQKDSAIDRLREEKRWLGIRKEYWKKKQQIWDKVLYREVGHPWHYQILRDYIPHLSAHC